MNKHSTLRYTHTPLGIIHPPHRSKSRRKKEILEKGQGEIQIESRPVRIERRNHDHNEIEHAETLPNRLLNPHIYIEKIFHKHRHYIPFLGQKTTGVQQYERTVHFFQKLANQRQLTNKKQLHNIIHEFMVERGLNSKSKQLLIKKENFLNLLMKKFYFEQADAEEFWHLAYNSNRFSEKQVVSMEAFMYNFDKYYLLKHEKFTNMFSQAALRQRVIDLRLTMHEWKVNNIHLKQYLWGRKMVESDMTEFLKQHLDEHLNNIFVETLQNRNKAYLVGRTLAKCLYDLTDEKYLSHEKVASAFTEMIQSKTNMLKVSQNVLRKFMAQEEITEGQTFPITSIVEFANTEGFSHDDMNVMVKWMRGLCKYLYYQHHHPCLKYTQSLECTQLISISSGALRQFQGYLKSQCDDVVAILAQLNHHVEECLKSMPELGGKKRFVVECNYVSEGLLRFWRGLDFSPFYKIHQMTELYLTDQHHMYEEIMKQTVTKETAEKTLKVMFKPLPNLQELEEEQYIQSTPNIGDKLKQYKKVSSKIKHPKPNIVLHPQKQKKLRKKETESSQQEEREISPRTTRQQCHIGHEVGHEEKKMDSGEVNVHYHHCYLRQCCMKVSLQDNQSISTVEGLQSKLMDLLNM